MNGYELGVGLARGTYTGGSMTALEAETSRGALLPRRARARYRLAVGLLRDAAGPGDALELELNLEEAVTWLWVARAEALREMMS